VKTIIGRIRSKITQLVDYFLMVWPSVLFDGGLRRLYYPLKLVRCGAGLRIADNVVITGKNGIALGENCSFMSRSYLYAHAGGVIVVGDNISVNHNVIIGAAEKGRIAIGNDVLIGPNVVIRASDHVFSDSSSPIREQGHDGGVITIEDDVWIASNVVITKNVRIGRGAVVAAGSVITKDIPSMTVCAGIPAEPISQRKW